MITKIPNNQVGVNALPCALIQGASPRPHVATVVLMAVGFAQIQGAAVSDAKYGGSGSRAWSPPV